MGKPAEIYAVLLPGGSHASQLLCSPPDGKLEGGEALALNDPNSKYWSFIRTGFLGINWSIIMDVLEVKKNKLLFYSG